MCFVSVKEEEDYSVPARRVRRVRRERTPSPRRSARFSRTIVEERRPSSRASFAAPPPPPPPAPPSTIVPPPQPAPASSVRSRSRTNSHYVEVAPSSSSSSSSSSDDLRSRVTKKSHRTSAPGSEYHIREKEYRRSRGYSQPRQPEYETFRYVDAPSSGRESRGGGGRDRSLSVHVRDSGGPRSSYHDDPGASKQSYGRQRERIEVDDGYGRRRREYRP